MTGQLLGLVSTAFTKKVGLLDLTMALLILTQGKKYKSHVAIGYAFVSKSCLESCLAVSTGGGGGWFEG